MADYGHAVKRFKLDMVNVHVDLKRPTESKVKALAPVTLKSGSRSVNTLERWQSGQMRCLGKAESVTALGFESLSLRHFFGGIAQLGEHLLCKQDVVGSIPTASTIFMAIN